MRRFMFATAACALLAAAPAAAKTQACATKASDAQDVEQTIKALFAAIERDDIPAARKLTTPGFHAFDVGRHFAGTELLDMIDGALKKGSKIGFSIEKVETRVDCNFAWAHWVNPGHINNSPVTWQESGVFRRTGNGWVMEFLHSERLAAPAAK